MTDILILPIAEDLLFQVDLEEPVGTTGIWDDATSLTDVEFRIAATKTGDAIGALHAEATERSNKAGRYYAVFGAGALTDDLTDYLRTVVWGIVSRSGHLDFLWIPFRVVPDRGLTQL